MTDTAGSTEPSGTRVLIADDQAIFRRGLCSMLGTEPGIVVIGEAEDGEEAVTKAADLAPDVVVMDVRMPRMTGIEAARRIRDETPTTKIVMLTISDEEDDLYAAIKAGANGYLLKDVAVDEIAEAVHDVMAGQSRISPAMASKLLSEFSSLAQKADAKAQAAGPVLTNRELEVLRHVAKGQSNKEIGGDLFISENTVKNHVRNILEKLHLHSRMEAVLYAMRRELLDLNEVDEGKES